MLLMPLIYGICLLRSLRGKISLRFRKESLEEIMANENYDTKASQEQPRGAHLNGSVPLGSAEEVFRMASSILGGRLRRIPDGETGVRTNWIGWQIQFLAANPHFEMVPADPEAYAPSPRFKLRSPVAPREITF